MHVWGVFRDGERARGLGTVLKKMGWAVTLAKQQLLNRQVSMAGTPAICLYSVQRTEAPWLRCGLGRDPGLLDPVSGSLRPWLMFWPVGDSHSGGGWVLLVPHSSLTGP